MKITCESCSAQYDLDDARIPPSGLTMKCPACLHSFTVRKGAAPPPPDLSDGIALSDLSEVTDDADKPELPAPVTRRAMPGPAHEREEDVIDLPAPKSEDLIDLPAPRTPAAAKAPPLPPVTKAPLPPVTKAPPPPPMTKAPPPIPVRPQTTSFDDDEDLPAPRAAEVVDLLAPKSGFAHPTLNDDAPDLLTPKHASAPSVGIGLDTPEVDDLLEPVGPSPVAPPPAHEGDYGPPPVDLDNMDVVAPKADASDLLTPKLETMDVAPQTMDVAPVDRPLPDPKPMLDSPSEPAAVPPAQFVPDTDDQPRRRLPQRLVLGGGALLLIGALGVSLGLFTSSGFFGVNLINGKHAEVEAKLAAARKLLAEDTLVAYRRAAAELHPLVEADPKDAPVAALEAQARYCAARLGIAAEAKNADRLLDASDSDGKADSLPDVQKARALKLVVGGRLGDARTKLAAVLAAAPADASALVYLGWTELGSGDWAAAAAAFAKAVAVEPNRAAALYGLGLSKERQGDFVAAQENYGKTLARSSAHFGAQVALARLAARRGAPQESADKDPPDRRIAELIEKRATSAAPNELADAWATLGVIAADGGRRDEAEDRLKRALALDPDSVLAKETLSRVLCEQGRPADAVAPLRKLLLAQPKNLSVRLTLVRALIEGKTDNFASEAQTTLAPAVSAAPKDPRVLFWQGRLALAGDKIDREGALAKFKATVETDPKFLPAYLAESTTLGQLGRNDEALEVLKQAAAKSADDAQLLTELGAAYLGLGKPADAELQLHAALTKQPDLHEAHMLLGAALEAQGKLDEAAGAYAAVAEKAPKYPGLLERQGRVAVKQGKKDEAWRLFQAALQDGVPTQSLRLAAADLALDLGMLDDAQKMAEVVAKEDDRSPLAHLQLARVQLAKGHAEEALPEARRAAMLSDLPEAHLALGHALEALNKLDQSVAEYQLARRGTVEPEATLGRARIMVRMGATKDALSELAALVKDNKLRAPALLLMGDCYSDLQQIDRARHAYEDAVKYGPQLGDAAFKYGRSLHDAGRRPQAITQLERALKLGGDKAPYAAEAYLLLGDSHRESHERDPAVKAYKKYLELAPADSPERAEVEKHISILGGRLIDDRGHLVDFSSRLKRFRKTVQLARSAMQIFSSTGLRSALSPKVALQMARDSRRVKGTLAIIHLHALTDPLRPALVSGEVRLNYGELEERVHRLTHGLRALGVGVGDRVGLMVHNGHEHLELSAAVQVLGATCVQIGYRLKGPEVAYILENAGARVLVFHADLAPAVDDALKEAKLERTQCIAIGVAAGYRRYEDLLESGDPLTPAQVEGGGVGGVMVYTSGTTGRSKGATRDFRRMGLEPILNFIKQFPLRRDERHLVVCPLYHSAAPAFVSMVLSVGGCNVILPQFEPELVLRTIERERITSSMMVPTMYARLTALPHETLRKYDLSSLRWLMSGAAPLPTELARRVEDAFGPILYNFYGATETGTVTIALPGEHTARPGTIGRAIGGNEIRLLDNEGNEVPVGEVGELYVRNAMLMDGYFGNQKATDDATRHGMISVGDLAWRDADGYFYLADRKSDMVISGGVNIYPWEIEQRLHDHPAVQDAAVVGVPDVEWGESLAAFVVLRAGHTVEAEALRDWVRETLADFKRPRQIYFVDALPRNPTGKVLKRELKQRAAQAVIK